jgi:peptide chain release factor 2
MGETNFWDDQEKAKATVAELKLIKAAIEPIEGMLRDIGDVRAMYELGEEAGDADMLAEADQALTKLEPRG